MLRQGRGHDVGMIVEPMANMLCPRLVLFGLAGTAAAQVSHLVGPGGFAQIRDALAVAAPGDVILVQDGTYAHFDVHVGVTIRAMTTGNVFVAYDPAFAPPCGGTPACVAAEGPTRFLVAPGQVAHVVGLQFVDNSHLFAGGGLASHRVEVTGGRVTFDQCAIRGSYWAALTIDHANAHLQACLVSGSATTIQGFSGMVATSSTITVVGGWFSGGPVSMGAGAAGYGIALADCEFVGSGFGASGGFAGVLAGSGLYANGGATWVADATVSSANWVCPMVISGQRHVARTALNGGTYPTVSCNFVATDAVLGVQRPAPLRVGSTFGLGFTGVDGFVAAFASPSLLSTPAPLLATTAHLDPTGLIAAGVALASPLGTANLAWPIANVPALVDQTMWFQGVTGLTLPLRVGPVTGGLIAP